MSLPVPSSSKIPAPISVAAMLFVATEKLFFSDNNNEVLAIAAWMLMNEDCTGSHNPTSVDCKPDVDNFRCLMCGSKRDHRAEVKRIWSALPDDRRYFINRVLATNGVSSNALVS